MSLLMGHDSATSIQMARFRHSQQRRQSEPSEREKRRAFGVRSERTRYDWPRSRTGSPEWFRERAS